MRTILTIFIFIYLTATIAHSANLHNLETRILVDKSVFNDVKDVIFSIENTRKEIIKNRNISNIIDMDTLSFNLKISEENNLLEESISGNWDLIFTSHKNSKLLKDNYISKAFDIPFEFEGVQSLINFQSSALAAAELSKVSKSGFISLSFINLKTERTVTPIYWDFANDIKGAKIANPSGLSVDTIQKLGASAVAIGASDKDVEHSIIAGGSNSFTVSTSSSQLISAFKDLQNMKIFSANISNQVGEIFVNKSKYDEKSYIWRTLIEESIEKANQQNNYKLVQNENNIDKYLKLIGIEKTDIKQSEKSKLINMWLDGATEEQRLDYRYIRNIINQKHLINKNKSDYIIIKRREKFNTRGLYFATTRDEEKSIKDIKYRYGDGRTTSGTIKCGKILYKYDKKPSLPMFSGEPFKNNSECYKMIGKLFDHHETINIFVHGYANSFEDAVNRGMFINEKFENKSAILLWSWPSKKIINGSDYDYDKESATASSTVQLKGLISYLSKISSKKQKKLNIIAHSMGAWHTLASLQHLAPKNPSSKIIDELIMAAPDVPKDEFSNMMDLVGNLTSRSTMYSCSGDLALSISKQINQYDRAGSSRPEMSIHKYVESIDVDPKFLSINHSYVFEPGIVADDLFQVSQSKPIENRNLKKNNRQGKVYWEIN